MTFRSPTRLLTGKQCFLASLEIMPVEARQHFTWYPIPKMALDASKLRELGSAEIMIIETDVDEGEHFPKFAEE